MAETPTPAGGDRGRGSKQTTRNVASSVSPKKMRAPDRPTPDGLTIAPRDRRHYNEHGDPKRAHTSREYAIKQIRSLILANKAAPGELVAYDTCPCGMWHVGHPDDRGRR